MIGCTKKACCTWTSAALGLVFISTGCLLVHLLQLMLHNEINKNLPLVNGSDSFKNWISPPVPVYFQIWVQHIVNPEEVIRFGARPVLKEKGPYTYREKRQKVNITFNSDHTVSYREDQYFFFDREHSVGLESDRFTTVNMPMLVVANLVRFEYAWLQDIVNLILDMTKERLFIELSVADLMWGYEDNLLKEVKKFGLPVDDRFGLFYKQNGTDTGLYRIISGNGGTIDNFAEIISWNGNRTLHFWKSNFANMINGTDGTLYPPFIDTSRSYYLFSSDLCRSLPIQFKESYKLKGITLERFFIPPETFANVSTNPENKGFCTPNCLPAGLLNASVCREGAPVIYSLPHFLDGDLDIQQRVIGMYPDREQHQSIIDIEPLTGVVMNAAKRLQINTFIEKIPHIQDTINLQEYIILPILWLNESATIDDKSASDFKSSVLVPVNVTEVLPYGLIGIGTACLLLALFLVIKRSQLCRCNAFNEMPVGERTYLLS